MVKFTVIANVLPVSVWLSGSPSGLRIWAWVRTSSFLSCSSDAVLVAAT